MRGVPPLIGFQEPPPEQTYCVPSAQIQELVAQTVQLHVGCALMLSVYDPPSAIRMLRASCPRKSELADSPCPPDILKLKVSRMKVSGGAPGVGLRPWQENR